MRLAVIMARGGSKRIPRKNIRPFRGRPAIAWSIAAAQESGLFDRIVVSTEDEQIAELAQQCGAERPFLRPPALAGDFANTNDVMAHAAAWACTEGPPPRALCCIYAAAPLLRAQDLRRAWDLLQTDGCSYSFPVTRFPAPVHRSFTLNQQGGIDMLFPQHLRTRSQDLPAAFHDAGQFYWGQTEAWLNGERIFSATARPVVIPAWRVQDIDTEEDWTRAEMLSRLLDELREDES